MALQQIVEQIVSGLGYELIEIERLAGGLLRVTIQQQVLKLLQRLQRERALSYLLITHDVDVIRAMAHDVLVMKDGEIVESGTLAQVLDAPHHPYTRRLVESVA